VGGPIVALVAQVEQRFCGLTVARRAVAGACRKAASRTHPRPHATLLFGTLVIRLIAAPALTC
jgi:hypothetical protein